MPHANSAKGRSRQGLALRLWHWIDRRTGADQILRQSLDEPIPGGARFAYVFGSALLFIFLSQIVTGTCLALYYVPSPLTAHTSVAYIVKEVAAGSFLRSLHSYGSSAMLIVLLLHFLQTFLYGSYKGRRELLWVAGCMLALLVAGMAFTGYLLPWDQSAYSAGSVGTNIIAQVPFIGEGLSQLLRGGAVMGALTLSRFYVLHVFIIPGLILSLIAIHIALFRKAGAAGPLNEDAVKPRLPAAMFYPKQVVIDMAFVLLVMGVLGMLAHFVPVMLGLEADPTNTRYLPRPEWYFVPMFQWLKYWEGWRTVIGVFIIPATLIGLFFLLPFIDRGPERRPWRRPIPVGGVFIVLIGLAWLGMASHLDDSSDPAVAAQLAAQNQQEAVYFHAAFQPYSAPAPAESLALTSLDSTGAHGKAIFAAHGCTGCHGVSGGGGVGPALTHIATQYPAAQLTALLRAPRANMKAAGMVPLTLSAADMQALVSYLTSLGGTSPAPTAGATPPGSSSPVTTPAAPAAAASKPTQVPTQLQTASSKVGDGRASPNPSGQRGDRIFNARGCPSCHGAGGIGTSRAPALAAFSKTQTAAALTSLLEHPTAAMQAGGMPTITLSATDMTALVAYLQGLPGQGGATAQHPAGAHGGAALPDSLVVTDRAISAGRVVVHGEGMCVVCHGPNLEGGVGPSLTAHAWKDAPDGSLAAILAVINTGVAGTTMVAHSGGISDEQARDAAAYVWALSHNRAKP